MCCWWASTFLKIITLILIKFLCWWITIVNAWWCSYHIPKTKHQPHFLLSRTKSIHKNRIFLFDIITDPCFFSFTHTKEIVNSMWKPEKCSYDYNDYRTQQTNRQTNWRETGPRHFRILEKNFFNLVFIIHVFETREANRCSQVAKHQVFRNTSHTLCDTQKEYN